MNFSKAALLIEASDVKGQQEIPGARKDVANWSSYLSSDIGGVWTNIDVMNKPTRFDVIMRLATLSAIHKYVFVAFSGHGRHDSRSGRDLVLLNDVQEVDVCDLSPSCKSTVIIDSCRGVDEPYQVALSATNSAFEGMYRQASARKHPTHYQTFFDAFVQLQTGTAKMFSCSVGEGAEEDPDSGGLFTSALLRSCRDWHNGLSQTPGVYTTHVSHSAVVQRFLKQRVGQKPQFSYTLAGNLLPMAVKP